MCEEKCKFYKKQFLSKYCELFKQPCYGKHCNFHKEFIKLKELEQQLQTAKEENEKLKDKCGNCPIMDVVEVQKEVLNTLTQQNKQMREALEKIKEISHYADGYRIFEIEKIAQQTLKGVE